MFITDYKDCAKRFGDQARADNGTKELLIRKLIEGMTDHNKQKANKE